jgi:hypothetical protein
MQSPSISAILIPTQVNYKAISRVVLVQYWYGGVNYKADIQLHKKLTVWLPINFDDVIGIEESNGSRATVKVSNNEHPWTTDIRSLSQMLDGTIPIPHRANTVKVNHHRANGIIIPTNHILCNECDKAFELRKRYRAEAKRV